MIPIPTAANRNRNRAHCHGDETPCAVCGRPTNRTGSAVSIRTWYDSDAVTAEEAARLSVSEPSGDSGCYPVGRDCLRKHPELKTYVV